MPGEIGNGRGRAKIWAARALSSIASTVTQSNATNDTDALPRIFYPTLPKMSFVPSDLQLLQRLLVTKGVKSFQENTLQKSEADLLKYLGDGLTMKDVKQAVTLFAKCVRLGDGKGMTAKKMESAMGAAKPTAAKPARGTAGPSTPTGKISAADKAAYNRVLAGLARL
jgi:hypothetical protein